MNLSGIITLLIIFIISRFSRSFFAILGRLMENQSGGNSGETYRRLFDDEDQSLLEMEEMEEVEDLAEAAGKNRVNVDHSGESMAEKEKRGDTRTGRGGMMRSRVVRQNSRNRGMKIDSERNDQDFELTETDILKGVIFKEILDQPRSRQPHFPIYLKHKNNS